MKDFFGKLTYGQVQWVLILVPLFLVVFAYFMSWAGSRLLVDIDRGLVTRDDDGLAPYAKEGPNARSSRQGMVYGRASLSLVGWTIYEEISYCSP